MRAIIEIEFEKVSGKKVDEKMANSGKFKKSAEKTIKKLCEQIERYFKDFKIKTKVTSKIEC